MSRKQKRAAAREQANRANAQLSTGPATPEGRAVSCLNHLVHGLSGAFRILKDENEDQFNELLAALRDEHAPETITEETLVLKIARHQWLADRALRLQSSAFGETTDEVDEQRLTLFTRYHTTHERAYYRALNQLLTLRKEARKAQVGFESQNAKQREQQRKEELHQAKLEALQATASARLTASQPRMPAQPAAAIQPNYVEQMKADIEFAERMANTRIAEMMRKYSQADDSQAA